MIEGLYDTFDVDTTLADVVGPSNLPFAVTAGAPPGHDVQETRLSISSSMTVDLTDAVPGKRGSAAAGGKRSNCATSVTL
jgi:hypothetical protein